MKIIYFSLIIIILLFFLGGCQQYKENNLPDKAPDKKEKRAIWLSYIEYEHLLTNKNEDQFTQNIQEVFTNIKNLNLNTIYAHVRPFGDALYPSKYFPWSSIITGIEGKKPSFDPLQIMISQAHQLNLKLEAWINPYRIRLDDSIELSPNNPAIKMLETKDAIHYNNLLFYNPTSVKAQTLIINGICEIVKNYNIDGIHFDDYFYPTTDPVIDKDNYQLYQQNGGKLSLLSWRQDTIANFIQKCYQAIKTIKNTVIFGISPQGSIDENYNNQCLPINRILNNNGYIDYLCPQIYFGFNHSFMPFEKAIIDWANLPRHSSLNLYFGLAAYKIGLEDKWAGSGKYEWQENSNLLAKMINCLREVDNFDGFSLFNYQSLFYPTEQTRPFINSELQSIKFLLNQNN